MEYNSKQIFLTKQFQELTQDERNMINDWCQDEDEFLAIQKMLKLTEEMVSEESFAPSASVKATLDEVFAETHRNNSINIFWSTLKNWLFPSVKPLWYRPALQFAFLAVLALIALPFFIQHDAGKKDAQLAKNEKKTNQVNVPVTPKSDSVSFNEQGKRNLAETEKSEDQKAIKTIGMDVFEDIPVAAESFSAMEEPAVMATRGAAHPDGVYDKQNASFTLSLDEQEGVLDLLYPTF